MREIKEYTCDGKTYEYAELALRDLGYELVEPVYPYSQIHEVLDVRDENLIGYHCDNLDRIDYLFTDAGIPQLFKKDGKYYGFLGWKSFNFWDREITLLEADKIDELIEYCKEKYEQKILKDLEEYLVGETMSLSEMDSSACEITDWDEECLACGDYYEINKIPAGEEWGYAYGNNGVFYGCVEIDFKILERPECIESWSDMENTLVKVMDVWLI